MRVNVPVIAASLLLVVSSSAQTPQTPGSTATGPQRDAQAVTLLQQSISAFGPAQPSDSTATGNVTITAGSSTTQGTVTIMTRGTTQSSIQFQMPSDSWSVISSSGQANKIEASATTVMPLELSASYQSFYFPLAYLSGVLSNPDYAIQYVGQETIGSSSANHIQVQNTFNSVPNFQFLAQFTLADIWLDATTALPVKIAMIRRFGGGGALSYPMAIAYSNYQVVSGVKYPFTIQEYVTGTVWATTTIQSVTFNTGLTDSNFSLAQVAN